MRRRAQEHPGLFAEHPGLFASKGLSSCEPAEKDILLKNDQVGASRDAERSSSAWSC
eukprot:COSAG04_NODE_393_length_15147_cov_44.965643_8_plen_57_part_00